MPPRQVSYKLLRDRVFPNRYAYASLSAGDDGFCRLDIAQSGGVFDNRDAEGSVTVLLPVAASGHEFTFYVSNNRPVVIKPRNEDGGFIEVVAKGEAKRLPSIQSSTAGDRITITCVQGDMWAAMRLCEGEWGAVPEVPSPVTSPPPVKPVASKAKVAKKKRAGQNVPSPSKGK